MNKETARVSRRRFLRFAGSSLLVPGSLTLLAGCGGGGGGDSTGDTGNGNTGGTTGGGTTGSGTTGGTTGGTGGGTGATNYSPAADSTYFQSLSTQRDSQGAVVDASFTLQTSQTFVFRFMSDFKAQAAVLTPDQFSAFQNQQAFSGFGLFDGQYGYHGVTLDPGTYAVAMRSNVPDNNTLQYELDLPSNIQGWTRNDYYIADSGTLAVGARRWQPFTVQAGIRYLIDGDNSGLNSYVIPASELSNFQAGATFQYYPPYSSDSGDPSQYGFYELVLSPGDYYLAQFNPTQIGKTWGYIMERWVPGPGTVGTLLRKKQEIPAPGGPNALPGNARLNKTLPLSMSHGLSAAAHSAGHSR